MKDSIPEKRASRFLAGLPAVLRVAGSEQPCEAHNLSRSGALLIGPVIAHPGETLSLTLCSSGGDVSVEVAARAVRFEPDEAGVASRLAVEFQDLADAARAGIETLVARVLEGAGPTVLDQLPANASVEQIRAALEKIPLPHRMTLASRATPRDRALLLHDPNPLVIEALARNPQLLPPEVRVLLRLPVLLPSTLEVLARDPRWRGSEELRVLIAVHPSASIALAERIAETLSREGIQKLVRHGSLNASLRQKLLLKSKQR